MNAVIDVNCKETRGEEGKGLPARSAKRAATPYQMLRPILRRFVDQHIAGDKGADIVRRLRPQLVRPDVQASKWLARADVQAAIAERTEMAASLPQTLIAIEQRLAVIESLLHEIKSKQ